MCGVQGGRGTGVRNAGREGRKRPSLYPAVFSRGVVDGPSPVRLMVHLCQIVHTERGEEGIGIGGEGGEIERRPRPGVSEALKKNSKGSVFGAAAAFRCSPPLGGLTFNSVRKREKERKESGGKTTAAGEILTAPSSATSFLSRHFGKAGHHNNGGKCKRRKEGRKRRKWDDATSSSFPS